MNTPFFTIKDMVEFIWLYRNKGRVKCFVDWSREQIAFAIRRAIDCEGFAFATSPSGGRIAGLVLATPDHANKILRINHVLGETGALRALILSYKAKYSGYRITARRRGREVSYNGDRLARLAQLN